MVNLGGHDLWGHVRILMYQTMKFFLNHCSGLVFVLQMCKRYESVRCVVAVPDSIEDLLIHRLYILFEALLPSCAGC